MGRIPDKSRQFSRVDRFIVEFDRFLAVSAGRSHDGTASSRPANDKSRHLRESHNNAVAALGLSRGLKIAARSAAARSRAAAGESDAEETMNWLTREMHSEQTTPGPLAPLGYAGGLAIGIGSRLLGDEAGRRIAGSRDQIRRQTQRQRADRLRQSSTDPADDTLINSLRDRADASTCLCGPHGHRVRSRPMTRFFRARGRLRGLVVDFAGRRSTSKSVRPARRGFSVSWEYRPGQRLATAERLQVNRWTKLSASVSTTIAPA